jgi:para-aminobenzoate synthetase component I
MLKDFPYQLFNKNQLKNEFNRHYLSENSFLFIIDFKAENGYIIPQKELNSDFIQFDFTNANSSQPHPEKELIWDTFPIAKSDFAEKFNYVVNQIHLGNSFLTNLTQPTKIATNFSLAEIYEHSYAKYKLWLKDWFVVLSPEIFVKIQNGIISSYPMKGTINANVANAENLILQNKKEQAEHATIVDLIRNDLSIIADEVEVKRYRYVDKLQTNKGELLQVSSEICGKLKKEFFQNPAEAFFSLLPAGSISGAPKPKTLEIIEKSEGYDRGFYTGVCGWFDGENLNSAVMIRFIEQQGGQLVFKSGGGITSQSEMKSEYNELIQKVYVPIF